MTDRQAELDAALQRVMTSAREHLAAVTAAGGQLDDDRVWQAYVELNNASFAYDELLLDTFGEVTPWDVDPIDPAEADHGRHGVELIDAPDAEPVTISVRQRRDYLVPSTAALVRLAADARAAAPQGGDDDEDEPPTTVGEAVAELLQAGDGALGSLDVPELEPLYGVVTIVETERPIDPATVDVDDNSPFVLADTDRLLVRLDEQAYTDEDE